ncbi:MAG: hypothetical protein JXB47_20550 [Anaerolineae bacterium]|nr:hypothetical protein [Anaerolineae bacterium]
MAEATEPQIKKSHRPLEAFLRHQAKAAEHAGKAVFNLVPCEARRHGRAAARECLLSFRALIDGVVDRLDDKPAGVRPAAREPREPVKKIKVEVE